MQMQIPAELLVRQLQQIPGIRISVEYETPSRGQPTFSSDVKFGVWARYWLETYKKGIVKDNTYRSTYQEPVELHLAPYFGDWPLTAIKPTDVMVYFKLQTDVLAYETQKKVRNALRLIFEAAIESRLVSDMPVTRSLTLVSHIPPIQKHTWSAEQYETAYKFALTHEHGLAIITLMETAISRSELLGLRRKDHDVAGCAIRLENGLVGLRSTKTNKYELVSDGLKNKYRHRAIPLSPPLNGLLSLLPQTTANGAKKQYLFCGPDGGPYDPNNWYRRVLKKFMRELNEEHPEVPTLTTHELRHTKATLLKNEGRDLFSIARLLGHCDLNMLAKRYAHDDLEALRRGLGL